MGNSGFTLSHSNSVRLSWTGLKIFLAETGSSDRFTRGTDRQKDRQLSCVIMAPNFTDFKLHNTETTQKEYDSFPSHGRGAFSALPIPTLATRTANDLPATEAASHGQ